MSELLAYGAAVQTLKVIAVIVALVLCVGVMIGIAIGVWL